MDEKLKEIIKEYTVKLPKEVQDVINSFPWAEISVEIGEKFNLAEESLYDIQAETAVVLLGICPPDQYVQNIENKVGTTKDDAKKIADEANLRIFDPMATRIEERVKNMLGNKKISWDQNIEFILSGGNYFFFLNKPSEEINSSEPIIQEGSNNIADPREKFTI